LGAQGSVGDHGIEVCVRLGRSDQFVQPSRRNAQFCDLGFFLDFGSLGNTASLRITFYYSKSM
ncbi:MAG: hypothetical protein WBV80_16565, partial [Mycobacterium sp.]